ncbi:hypothetical protein MAR_011658 [Mya arenaria]|uniref:Uncharacterized protein n=1 Tax=Mya arenaria TaxID=6604 RepID=A0ABY7FYG1_MYAAR|nr:hypothetical protein MAR_011658 [Mya arenaria]
MCLAYVSGILSNTDPDFLSEVDSTEDFQVIAVQSVYCYQCCDRPETRKSQMANVHPATRCQTLNDIMVRFFMDNLKKLFKVDDNTDSNKLLQQLKTQVPVTERGRFTNTDSRFVKNNDLVSRLYLKTSAGQYETVAQTIVLQLAKGDDITVRNGSPDETIHGVNYSTFVSCGRPKTSLPLWDNDCFINYPNKNAYA